MKTRKLFALLFGFAALVVVVLFVAVPKETTPTTTAPISDQKNYQAEWGTLTFEQFTDKFYALDDSEQTRIWDDGLQGVVVTWEGIAIDSNIFIRADRYKAGMQWAVLSESYRPFAVSVQGNEKAFVVGERVKFTGKVATRGVNREGAFDHWRIEK